MARWGRTAFVLVVLAGTMAPAMAADTFAVAARAVVISKSSCRFSSSNGLVIAFGTIDPSSSVDALASVNLVLICNGSANTASYAIASDNGVNATGPGGLRLRHVTNPAAVLPYSLSAPPGGTVQKGVATTVAINGTITPANYANAPAGAYADTVTLTISP
jgi:spore coat protein U-like protein